MSCGRMAVRMVAGPEVWIGVGGVMAFALSGALGANDVANSLGTSVGTGAVKIGQALAIGATMEFAGSVLFGSTVTQTIASNVVTISASADPGEVEHIPYFSTQQHRLTLTHSPVRSSPTVNIYLGMCTVLAGGTAWIAVATKYGLPVSSTHSIIGSLVGLGIISGWGVNYSAIASIALSWVISPVIGGVTASALYYLVKKYRTKRKKKKKPKPSCAHPSSIVKKVVVSWRLSLFVFFLLHQTALS